jgi:hypothetical protein
MFLIKKPWWCICHVKPLGVGFTRIRSMLGSSSWGHYSHKTFLGQLHARIQLLFGFHMLSFIVIVDLFACSLIITIEKGCK